MEIIKICTSVILLCLICAGFIMGTVIFFRYPTDDQLIDQRAKELYIEYKACEKVEAMINAGK